MIIKTPPKPMPAAEVIERIQTMHWDIGACRCWICVAGRALGLHPRTIYPTYKGPYPSVRVDDEWTRWVPKQEIRG